jgi:guanosine-3',5'-bis(diphosphate) 3'-pyrophosphohydrolase
MTNISVQYDRDRYTPKQNKLIEDAVKFAQNAHGEQLRASGQPYIIHPVAVAETVAKWGLDYESVIAAILHDVVEDTDVILEDVSERFGLKVAELVDGVTKLRLSSSPRADAGSTRQAINNENLGKLLLATTRDYRVIPIKLADRLHNMRTLGYLAPERRLRIARESLEVYAPLADRLGMGQLKGELEDLGFKYSRPDESAELEKRVHLSAKKAERYLAVLKHAISEYLVAGSVRLIRIEARQKHYYSIWKKLAKVNGDIEKIYDLFAVRVIVPDVASCYQALGILHQHYKPLIYRIKDYIAVPKTNGYQSLHTTVFAEDGHITEIQIRTPEMHEAAEHGLAAHFYYDQQKVTKAHIKGQAAAVPDHLKWVRQLSQMQEEASSPGEFVEEVKLELFANRLYIFSPKGDLYELPEGSTPLDFAFAIHSNVGLRAMGARVNGRMVPLDSHLENRDVVEVITRREPAPNLDWLGYVATSHAKNRIRAWFRASSRDSNISSGRVGLEVALKTWNIRKLDELPKRALPDLINALHLRSTEDLYAALGEGTLSIHHVIRRLVPDAAKPRSAVIIKRPEPTGRVLVEGDQLPYTIASCCEPVFPVPLIGYVTRGKGITVHALGCRNVPTDVERYVTCRWETTQVEREHVLCAVSIKAIRRVGLISDITGAIAAEGFNISRMSTEHVEGGNEILNSVGVEVPDLFALANLMRKLERLPGVSQVHRLE